MEYHTEKYYSHEECFALEGIAEYKSEYYQGQIFAMANTSINHNQIIGNLTAKVNHALFNSKCEVFMSEIKVG